MKLCRPHLPMCQSVAHAVFSQEIVATVPVEVLINVGWFSVD